MLDCTDSSAVWCSDLEFSDQTAENWGWAYLKYGRGYDPPASLSDQAFTFRGKRLHHREYDTADRGPTRSCPTHGARGSRATPAST